MILCYISISKMCLDGEVYTIWKHDRISIDSVVALEKSLTIKSMLMRHDGHDIEWTVPIFHSIIMMFITKRVNVFRRTFMTTWFLNTFDCDDDVQKVERSNHAVNTRRSYWLLTCEVNIINKDQIHLWESCSK